MPKHTIYVGSRSWLVAAAAVWLALLALLTLGGGLLPLLGLAWLQPLAARLASPWVAAAATLLAVVLMSSAVGLVRRLEWARRAAIVLLGAAALAQLPGLWLLASRWSLSWVPGGLVGALVALALSALMLWLIRRLISGRERQEFA